MVRTKVFVGNLAFSTKEPELAAAFGAAGKVIGANIITRGPRSLGYGFVEMESEEDANKAVELMNKKEVNGRQINVEVAKPQEETKEKEPRPQGENGAAPRGGRRGGRGGGGRVRTGYRRRKEGEEGEGADDKAEEDQEGNEEGEGQRRPRRRNRGRTGQKRVSDESNEREESKTTLFVANLPFGLDDDGFAKVVVELGVKPKTAHVVKKRNGRSKGYGFVEFENEADQKKALDGLNKKVVEGRELSVKVALTEQPRGDEEEKPAQPAEKRSAPAEKKAAPVDKKPAQPSEKKTVPAEKKAASPAEKRAPAEKKTASPATSPAEKKTTPAEKKTAPAEKKATPPPERKTESPAKATSEKK